MGTNVNNPAFKVRSQIVSDEPDRLSLNDPRKQASLYGKRPVHQPVFTGFSLYDLIVKGAKFMIWVGKVICVVLYEVASLSCTFPKTSWLG